jgi:prepilin-type N-terminal cleavage/methylation domain-containing protein
MASASKRAAASKLATGDARAGFTLIETLAALAIASVIILSTGALIHQSVFFFDHGTRTVDQSEKLALAVESLTRDFGAARFVLQKNGNSQTAAFIGSPPGDDARAKIVFITTGGKVAGPQGEEVVNLTVEPGDSFTQLVRRRTPWLGPRMHLTDARTGDAVVLLKGKYDMSFSFSERTDDGHLIWHNEWTGNKGLPHSVRFNLQDSATGTTLLAGAEFPIKVDAPAACAEGEIDCLSLTPANPNPGTPPPANAARAEQ